jgi:hypothetical protein
VDRARLEVHGLDSRARGQATVTTRSSVVP